MSNFCVPFLKEKLNAVRALWLVDPEFRPRDGTDKAFLICLDKATGTNSQVELSTLQQMLSRARKNNRLPSEYMDALNRMYPAAQKLWSIETLTEFHSQIAARSEWINQQRSHIAVANQDRLKLVEMMRRYYSDLCHSDLPLLCNTKMVAKKPVPLTIENERKIISFTQTPYRGQLPKIDDSGLDFYNLKMLCDTRPLWNSYCYRLCEIGYCDEMNSPSFKFGEGDYRGYYATGEVLPFELARWVNGNPGRQPRPDGTDLPMRGSAKQVLELETRDAIPGICTLTVVIDKDKAKPTDFYLHKRSSLVAEWPELYHVAPAGSFQPSRPDFSVQEDCSFISNILRELSEEYFGRIDLQQQDHDGDRLASIKEHPVRVEADPIIMAMRESLGNKSSAIYLLGWGFDPCTLKPEILTLMIVVRQRLADMLEVTENSKYKDLYKKGHNYEGKFELREFNDRTLKRCYESGTMVSAGQACLQLAHTHLKYFQNEIVKVRNSHRLKYKGSIAS